MNLFRESHKTQVIRPQNPYFSNLSCGVCLQNICDYSPFGVSLDERTVESDFYRRGFNGMEKDDDVKGGGKSYDFGARINDARVGRWLTIDPMFRQYESLSTYNFGANSPLQYKDANGKVIVDPNGNIVFVKLGETKFQHAGAYGKSADVNYGFIFANDGTPILVYQDVKKQLEGANTDCHGVTFSAGQFWINNDQVSALLKGDGYSEVNYDERQWGDPIIYTNKNGEVEDSRRVMKDKNKAYGQGGLETKNTTKDIDKVWKKGSIVRIYHIAGNRKNLTYSQDQVDELIMKTAGNKDNLLIQINSRSSKLSKSSKKTHVVP
jgi:RHS repeat-associated protein